MEEKISLKSANQQHFVLLGISKIRSAYCQLYISAGKVKNNSNQIKLEMEVEIQREEKQDFRTNLRICGAVAI